MTSMEVRWRDALVTGLLPLPAGDTSTFWLLLEKRAPWQVLAGTRLSVWCLVFLPVAFGFGMRRFTRLSPEERDRYLTLAANSGHYPIRQMVETLKALGCLAAFHETELRRRFEDPDAEGH